MDDLTLGEVVCRGKEQCMQHILNDITNWCKANGMVPKPSKCCIMRISFLKGDLPLPEFTLRGSNLNVVSHMKLLGVIIQDNLKWDLHITDNCIKGL